MKADFIDVDEEVMESEFSEGPERHASSDSDNSTGTRAVIQKIQSARTHLKEHHEHKVRNTCLFFGLAGIVFVLVAKSEGLGAEDAGQGSSASSGSISGDHSGRRLGAGPPPILEKVAFSLTAAGVCGFAAEQTSQHYILGYIGAGILMGPIGLEIVPQWTDIQDFSSFGLIFLLFMLGLDLDLRGFFSDRITLAMGVFQFPFCVALHYALFLGFDAVGIDLGDSDEAVLYCSIACAVSSSLLVYKILQREADMDSSSGMLTVGVLLFQQLWALLSIGFQSEFSRQPPIEILERFGYIVLVMAVCGIYCKFVLPHVIVSVGYNAELKLIMSLCWCFFIGALCLLPFMGGLSLELAAICAGFLFSVFDHSTEFNTMIRYVHDFFIVLYFLAIGIMLPSPESNHVLGGLAVAVVVILVRGLGVYALILILGGGPRLALLATINLCQISELSIVICYLGMQIGHVTVDTMAIIIWAYIFLAVVSANVMPHGYKITKRVSRFIEQLAALTGQHKTLMAMKRGQDHDDEVAGMTASGHPRNVLLLSFHRVAAGLIYQLMKTQSHIVDRIVVIDNDDKTLPKVRAKGIPAFHCDISHPEKIKEIVSDAKIVLCTTPDNMLRGTSNLKLLRVALEAYPEAKVINVSDNPHHTEELYNEGAHYVIRSSCLCADRLKDLMDDVTSRKSRAHYDDADEFETMQVQEARVSKSHIDF